MKRGLLWLQISRPGLWFQTIWLYLLPTSGQEILTSPAFWLGFIYMTFPLNFLVYGWNDAVDWETDHCNPRKGSYLWGARAPRDELRRLAGPIIAFQVPFLLVFGWLKGPMMCLLLATIFLSNGLYNLPKRGWRARPPLELLNVLAFLLILPFSISLNQCPALPWQSYLYLVLFCLQAHLIGEVMDTEPDRAAGRQTSATILGVIPTKLLIMSLVLMEGLMLEWVFSERVLAVFMLFAEFFLIFDLVTHGKSGRYNRFQSTLFGWAINIAGYLSIAWIWWTGNLSRLV